MEYLLGPPAGATGELKAQWEEGEVEQEGDGMLLDQGLMSYIDNLCSQKDFVTKVGWPEVLGSAEFRWGEGGHFQVLGIKLCCVFVPVIFLLCVFVCLCVSVECVCYLCLCLFLCRMWVFLCVYVWFVCLCLPVCMLPGLWSVYGAGRRHDMRQLQKGGYRALTAFCISSRCPWLQVTSCPGSSRPPLSVSRWRPSFILIPGRIAFPRFTDGFVSPKPGAGAGGRTHPCPASRRGETCMGSSSRWQGSCQGPFAGVIPTRCPPARGQRGILPTPEGCPGPSGTRHSLHWHEWSKSLVLLESANSCRLRAARPYSPPQDHRPTCPGLGTKDTLGLPGGCPVRESHGLAQGSSEEEELPSLAFLLSSQHRLLPWRLPQSPVPASGLLSPEGRGPQGAPQSPSAQRGGHSPALAPTTKSKKRALFRGPPPAEQMPHLGPGLRVSGAKSLAWEMGGPSRLKRERVTPWSPGRRRSGHVASRGTGQVLWCQSLRVGL
uniref:Nuclear Testis protein N-terminal domain-containing protein n=1 Tax=Callithrix jacchus TaxID=9483 RepID=A0A5F4WHC2_CALJA